MVNNFLIDFISDSKLSIFDVSSFKDLSLSLDKNNGYVILHINRIRVKCWSRILANFHDKNQHYNLSVVKLEEMILNGDIKVKFNVSTIKDHGTQWCIAK